MRSTRFVFPRRLILILWWVGMCLATHLPDIDAYAPERVRHLRNLDKVVHLSLYLGWGLLWAWVLSAGGRTIRWWILAILFVGGALWGILDETTQAFVRRHPDVWDWAFDMLGLTMAVLIVAIRTRMLGRKGVAPPVAAADRA